MISEPLLVALREEQPTAEQPSCVDHDPGATQIASTRKNKKRSPQGITTLKYTRSFVLANQRSSSNVAACDA